jgi:hypothetical protein
MAHHNGSVIDHVHLRVADVEKRKRFCSAALSTLRLKLKDQDRSFFFGDEFFVEKADGIDHASSFGVLGTRLPSHTPFLGSVSCRRRLRCYLLLARHQLLW